MDRKEYLREWKKRNAERVREYRRREREGEYNSTDRSEYFQKYRDEHKEETRQYHQARRSQTSPEALRAERARQYYTDIEASRAKAREYRNRRRANMQGNLTTEEWEEILWEFGYRCAYCQAEEGLTQDHVTPVSRGGRHSKENVVPACELCNKSKGAKSLLEFAGITPIKLRV